VRLDPRPCCALAKPIVLRHRRGLVCLEILGRQKQDIGAASRQGAPNLRILKSMRWATACRKRAQSSKWSVVQRSIGMLAFIAPFPDRGCARAAAARE
jgi:hypothetical protein